MRGLGPNAGLIGAPGSRARLLTPALVLDLDAFERNLARMAAVCGAAGIGLRPHAKSHKSVAIARRQIEHGALGVSCASLREAEAMAAGGIAGILVTSPVAGAAKVARLIEIAARAPSLTAVVDDEANLAEIGEAAQRTGVTLGGLVDIDLGQNRTGVRDAASAVRLATAMERHPHLVYRGVQAYSGAVQHIERLDERRAAYGTQIETLRGIVAELTRAGLAPGIVTGGGTGSNALDRASRIFTEVQPGSYIFMDVQYNAVEMTPEESRPFEVSLFVQSAVVSANVGGQATIDAGIKCLATDGPAALVSSGAPAATEHAFFGDEHGRLVLPRGSNVSLRPGERVELVTPHCDPTVNLHDWFHCVRGDTLVDVWPVDARGVL